MKRTCTYTVEGGGNFPIDMLRYDSAWPHSQDDVSRIIRTFERPWVNGSLRITVTGLHQPTTGRWESFGWKVREVTR